MESDPTGKGAHDPGAKLDAGKAKIVRGLLQSFPLACAAVAQVTERGAVKYAWGSWALVPDGVGRYLDAMGRHVAVLPLEGEYDRDGFLHRAQIAWNSLASLELWLREQANDAGRSSQGEDQGVAQKP